MQLRSVRTHSKNRQRGVATVWTILTIPVVLTGLAGVVELGHLWLVRGELQTSLESAALAGVKTWADLSEADLPNPQSEFHRAPGAFAKTSAARTAAQAAFAVNPIFGQTYVLARNENDNSGYDNASCTGDIVLGGITSPLPDVNFSTTANVGCGRADPNVDFAVLAQKTIAVTPLVKTVFGVAIPSFNVSSRAIAIARCRGGASIATVENPQLVHVTTITCP
jgi:Flp pilus assembly protein TadG